jgi:hypothetical protein
MDDTLKAIPLPKKIATLGSSFGSDANVRLEKKATWKKP